MDLEQAVLVIGRHLLRLDAVGKGKGPLEHPVATLTDQPSLFGLLDIGLPLSLDGEDSVGHFDVDVLRLHTGNLGVYDHLIITGLHVDPRHPRDGGITRPRGAEPTEQPVHLPLHARNLAEWIPADDRHCKHLQVAVRTSPDPRCIPRLRAQANLRLLR